MARVADVKGAFLLGEFDEKDQQIYIKVPEGFQKFYPKNSVLLLKRTLYGLKQAAREFYNVMIKIMKHMEYERTEVDPCLYHKWDENGLSIWFSWVDDLVHMGNKNIVGVGIDKLKKVVLIDDVGDLKEYVGMKIEINQDENSMKLTQPVTVKSFRDEFELPSYEYKIPAAPGSVLRNDDNYLDKDETTNFRKGVGKLLHVTRWTRPDTCNSVRDLTRRLKGPSEIHNVAMLRVMRFLDLTKEKGWTLKPSRVWDGMDKSFEFMIRGRSDSDHASCPDSRKSVSGYMVYLEDTMVAVKSNMQKRVALSSTEAELYAAVSCVQMMMYIKRILKSLSLQVKLPMVMETDNKGVVDLIDNWSIDGNTKHVETRIHYMRELKEDNIVKLYWIPREENESDMLVKNATQSEFEKHSSKFIA